MRIQFRGSPGLKVLFGLVGEFPQLVGMVERSRGPPMIGLDFGKHETGNGVLLLFRQGPERLDGLFHQSSHTT